MSSTLERPPEKHQSAMAVARSEKVTATIKKPITPISKTTLLFSLLIGVYFGVVLTKSEVVRWQRVHDMFLFQEAHMYLIIGLGIGVAMVSMWLLKRFQVQSIATGQRIEYKPKPWHSGVVIGGTLFGAGWAITGACPGPIYAQIGGGAWLSLVTLAGALVGTFLFAQLKGKLPQ